MITKLRNYIYLRSNGNIKTESVCLLFYEQKAHSNNELRLSPPSSNGLITQCESASPSLAVAVALIK